jgi:hypothetical protein
MLIGVVGKAGSGKDTIADIFVEKYNFTKIGLADPIKRFLKEIFDFSDDQLWGDSQFRTLEDKRYPRTVKGALTYLTARYALQHLGTEFGRSCNEDVWANYAIKQYEKLMSDKVFRYNYKKGIYSIISGEFDGVKSKRPSGVVISDCRFNNEALKVKNNNGRLIKVIRNNLKKDKNSFRKHISETELDSIPEYLFNHTIINDGTMEDLHNEVDKIAKLYI